MISIQVYCNYDAELDVEYQYTEEFESEAEALAFCKEEVKWESCKRVVCEQLGIDMKGDFAS